MALWHLYSRTPSRLRLWRTGAYRFRVVEYGEPVDVLTNHEYILFDRKYEGALRSTGAQLQLTPVIITDEVRQLEWRNYLEATIAHVASAEEISHSFPPGPVICRYGEQEPSVFVSEPLKALLQLVQRQALGFSPGFSGFAA